MKTIDERRSVRQYTAEPLTAGTIEALLRAGMQAPSAANQQPWKFIVAQNSSVRETLSQMSPYAASVRRAPVAIVLLGDTKEMRFPQNWQQDMGACAQNILLEAVDLGLGGVWLGVAGEADREEKIRQQFNLPENLKPFAVLAIGHPKKGQENTYVDRYDASRVYYDGYEN